MQCIITEKQFNKLTHYDEAKKMAHGPHIVRAKETLNLSAKDKHQAPNNGLKLYVTAVVESEAWPTVVQIKRKP